MDKKYNAQSGNVFFIIFIAIILFGAVMAFLSKGTRTGEATISSEQARLHATEILDYARTIADAVQTLRIDGCSDTEISFETPLYGGYTNPSAPPDNSCHVFHSSGGGVNYRFPEIGTVYRFSGNNRFYDFGCSTLDPVCSELTLTLQLNDAPEVCLKVNDMVGITNPSGDAPQLKEWSSASVFTGTYAQINTETVGGLNVTDEAPEVRGKTSGCFFEFAGGQDTYYFYQVLIKR